MTMFGSQWFANTADAGYEVDYSCRFNFGDSAYMSKSFAGDGDSNTQITVSFWAKRANLATNQGIISMYTSGADRWGINYGAGWDLKVDSITLEYYGIAWLYNKL